VASKFDRRLSELQSQNLEVRRKAALKLSEYGRREAVPALCAALDDPSWKVRRNAAISLGKIADPASIDALSSALGDQTKSVSKEAARALASIQGFTGDNRAAEALYRGLQDKRETVQQRIKEALFECQADAAPLMCQALQHSDPDLRAAGLEILKAMLDGWDHRIILSALLADPRLSTQERFNGLEALSGYRGRLRLVPYILDTRRYCQQMAASGESEAVRRGALAVLDYMSLPRAGQRDLSAEPHELLRGAGAVSTADAADVLLRGTTPAEPLLEPPQKPLLRLWLFILNILRRVMRRSQRSR
jgi:HEAT repeat protein